MAAGSLFSLIHAAAAISFRADQTVSGVAINMLALGATLFIVKLIYGKAQTDKIPEPFYKTKIPGLGDIPVLGKIFFSDVYYTSILAIALAFIYGLSCSKRRSAFISVLSASIRWRPIRWESTYIKCATSV